MPVQHFRACNAEVNELCVANKLKPRARTTSRVLLSLSLSLCFFEFSYFRCIIAHLVITLGQRVAFPPPPLVAVLMLLREYFLGRCSRAFVIFMYDRCKKGSRNKTPRNLARV